MVRSRSADGRDGPKPGQHVITGHRGHGTGTVSTGTSRTRSAVGDMRRQPHFDTDMGYSIAAQPGDRNAASHTSPLARRARDALVRTSPERNRVAQVLGICHAVRINQSRRSFGTFELRSASQTEMIEAPKGDRQYFHRKNFRSRSKLFDSSRRSDDRGV